jgi:hypothetical protein
MYWKRHRDKLGFQATAEDFTVRAMPAQSVQIDLVKELQQMLPQAGQVTENVDMISKVKPAKPL